MALINRMTDSDLTASLLLMVIQFTATRYGLNTWEATNDSEK